MDAKYINKNYLEDSIKNYDTTIIDPIRNVTNNIYYNTAIIFNSVNNRYNDLLNVLNASVSGGIGLDLQLNYINSASPVNYQQAENIVFTAGQIGNIWCSTSDKAGTQYYDWNSQTKTLTFSSLTGLITLNKNIKNIFDNCSHANFIGEFVLPDDTTDMNQAFYNCGRLNQNILIPDGVTDMYKTFSCCYNLNQNILIPNSVTNMSETFSSCSNLNQNILIPDGVTDISCTFSSCSNLNQNILIPNSVTDMFWTFRLCNSLNQNILIPNSVTNMAATFESCSNLNQNILIPNSVTDMHQAFQACNNLNQSDIYIYSQNISNMKSAFGKTHIGNIHIPTSVPKDTSNYMYNCLVNGNAGITFAPENIINDLPVDIAQWPPV